MPKIPAENVNIPAKVVTNIQNINITMNSSVNIQVAGETSQQSTQTAELKGEGKKDLNNSLFLFNLFYIIH